MEATVRVKNKRFMLSSKIKVGFYPKATICTKTHSNCGEGSRKLLSRKQPAEQRHWPISWSPEPPAAQPLLRRWPTPLRRRGTAWPRDRDGQLQ